MIIVIVSLTEECWLWRLELTLLMGWQMAQCILGRLSLLGLLVVMRSTFIGTWLKVSLILIFLLRDLQLESLQRRGLPVRTRLTLPRLAWFRFPRVPRFFRHRLPFLRIFDRALGIWLWAIVAGPSSAKQSASRGVTTWIRPCGRSVKLGFIAYLIVMCATYYLWAIIII